MQNGYGGHNRTALITTTTTAPPKKGNAPPNVHATGNEESGVLIYKMELRQDFPYVRVGSAKCTVKKHDTHEAFS